MKAEALPMPDSSSRLNEQTMPSVISVTNLSKTYASGFQALRAINLDIRRGEIFALLGPNGAGKTTLINIICGIVNPTEGRIVADGHDIIADYRAARAKIGLVPQELTTDAFETVWATVSFSRGLFGKRADPAYIETVLRELQMFRDRGTAVFLKMGRSWFWAPHLQPSTCREGDSQGEALLGPLGHVDGSAHTVVSKRVEPKQSGPFLLTPTIQRSAGSGERHDYCYQCCSPRHHVRSPRQSGRPRRTGRRVR